MVIRFAQEGFPVVGFDIDDDKVKLLNAGKSYMKHIDEKAIASMVENGFTATSDFSQIATVDVIIICVPTPLGVHREPDLSYIINTMDSINPYLTDNQLLVLESTTYPGTTEEEIVPLIERAGFIVGKNIFVGYSPEREDPGNKKFKTKNITKIVSGHTTKCLHLTNILYEQIIDNTHQVSSTGVAEMTKILENIHRAVNIGLVNELKILSDKMNLDIYEVIEAAATKPFGFTPYYPGPGLGGHCIPIDPFYLTWKAKELGMNTRFIELAGEINTSMPDYVIKKVVEGLNSIGKSILNSEILLLGLSYKKNIDDTRESPSFVIMQKILEMGGNLEYSDPYFSKAPSTRKYNFDKKSIKLTEEIIKSFDLIILATDHDKFDYKLIGSNAKLIIDTRGRFRKKMKNVISA